MSPMRAVTRLPLPVYAAVDALLRGGELLTQVFQGPKVLLLAISYCVLAGFLDHLGTLGSSFGLCITYFSKSGR